MRAKRSDPASIPPAGPAPMPESIPDQLDVSFSVPHTHRLRFTTDALGSDQQTLCDLFEPSGDRPPRVQFWIDQDVAEANPSLLEKIREFARRHAGKFTTIGNIQQVPGGEVVKNEVHIIERMLKCINAAGLDRRSYVVVIGGGAVLDAVGFAAAISHRGIRLVRLPTTTLAQADSGIGVKNSINLFAKKNWCGTFAVPWGVVNDQKLLETLPDRDFVCGFSEAIKVSLLKDADLFERLCDSASAVAGRDPVVTAGFIRESARWHLEHITRGGDPFENREARPLDFGHWSAHKLEVMTDFELRHGEAVAIGLAIDLIYSGLALGFPERDVQRGLRAIVEMGLPLSHPALSRTPELFAGLEEFRQHLGGRLTITMLRNVGEPVNVHQIDERLMREAISRVRRVGSEHAAEFGTQGLSNRDKSPFILP